MVSTHQYSPEDGLPEDIARIGRLWSSVEIKPSFGGSTTCSAAPAARLDEDSSPFDPLIRDVRDSVSKV
jgi:hypothetical protein